ncbi:MAG: S8 family serine peptidase, partial [Spirochaetaceae bacterium]|nr:S8 family serine peptidase [Spirochaetaceae bacterium]
MRASTALRRALAGGAAVLVALPLAPGAALAEGTSSESGDADVRLVVLTSTRAAGTEVLAAAVRRGARPAGRVPRLRAVALEVAAADADSVSRALRSRDDVRSVEVAHRRWLSEEPADPRFGDQRSYLDAIRATSAWARPAHGSPTVRIGIIDSGVDVSHPDLAGKIAGTFNAVDRSTDVRDLVGHGTGVASIAAAATGNGVGIAGAGYDSTILAAKVADRSGRIFTDDLAAGIVWAVDSGARVINLSLGGPSSDRLERMAVAYAQARDVLVVAAAGNDSTSRKQFPAALPDVLSVGAASTDGSTRAPFSTYGSWVDVAAPGRGLLVAAPGGGYDKADGTSFSTPLVSGQAALLEGYRPGRTSAELTAAVVGGANSARLGFAHG